MRTVPLGSIVSATAIYCNLYYLIKSSTCRGLFLSWTYLSHFFKSKDTCFSYSYSSTYVYACSKSCLLFS